MVMSLLLWVGFVFALVYYFYTFLENFTNNHDQLQDSYPVKNLDDPDLESYILNLKGESYPLVKNAEISFGIDNVVNNDKYKVLEIKNIVKIENGSYTLPIFVINYLTNIVRRVLLTLAIQDDQVIIKDVILPKNKDLSGVKTLPSLINSSMLADYYYLPKNKQEEDSYLILRPGKEKTVEKKEEPYYMCYGIPEFQKISSKDECELFEGVWDTFVEKDTDCPFYKANVNYPNERGRAKYGRCELPLGMKRLGFRYYSLGDSYQPLCYCNGKLGSCCSSQKFPDYAFSGDREDRLAYGLDVD